MHRRGYEIWAIFSSVFNSIRLLKQDFGMLKLVV